ncbi:MAG: histidinol-phosphatase HisJ family protein [Bacillota bacterium]
MIDLHLHTDRCGHARGTMQQYIARARELGLIAIGFADHIPMYWLPPGQRDPELAMPQEQFGDYVREVLDWRDKCPDIGIYLGVEADFQVGYEDVLTGLIKTHPLDYVLGSIHFIDGWGFDNPALRDEYARHDPDELYESYFALVEQAVASGLFDSMAHVDLLKKFAFWPRRPLTHLYQRLAGLMAQADVCVELNTAGLRVPANEMYPAVELLRACFQHCVPVTLGSDAHAPEQVGWEFGRAINLLREVGYGEITYFVGRRRFCRRLP